MASLPPLVRDLSGDALSQIAPDELFLLDSGQLGASTENSGSTGRGPQGFGSSDVIFLFAPFIVTFFTKFLEALASEVGKGAFKSIIAWSNTESDSDRETALADIREILSQEGLLAERLDEASKAILSALSKKNALGKASDKS